MEELKQFNFIVSVDAHNIEQAMEVMAHRIGHDEDYGFVYNIDWVYANVMVEQVEDNGTQEVPE